MMQQNLICSFMHFGWSCWVHLHIFLFLQSHSSSLCCYDTKGYATGSLRG
uniref:Uncharacterized protein n=1 Tax=Rhizophora mucronata TaxID=61149 RepID=A0A2P2NKS7_RHIMU